MQSFDLSFDYRCPFAKNLHLHVITALRAGADLDVNFMPWSLTQGGKPDDAPDVWNDPSLDAHLLALAMGLATCVRTHAAPVFRASVDMPGELHSVPWTHANLRSVVDPRLVISRGAAGVCGHACAVLNF